ncbi:hypothetical protein [Amycolatopsis sp. NPDC006125]|uniref:hypothetical protein n=1 Tax=Amycolatopsis sp. NPDC006125 TaxID=3156730 RepID=UPI0033A6F134
MRSGALGDVFGRRMFVLGLGLFVVSCALMALARGGWMVVVGRVGQGAAGAAWWSVPTAVCLAVTALAFPVVERRMAAPLVDLRLLRNPVLVGATHPAAEGVTATAAVAHTVPVPH